MSAKISIKVDQKDINKVINAFAEKNMQYRDDLQKAIDISALNIESNAKINVRNYKMNRTARLLAGIQRRDSPKDLTADVVSSANYSAYVEFGTGMFAKRYLADKPNWLKEYAWTFKRPRDGYRPARPFLFPAWESERPKFLERLKRVMSR